MVKPSDIGWGSYNGHEGPFFWGTKNIIMLQIPTEEEDKQLLVLSATEGKLDAANLYDSCIVSVGSIQWCEASGFNVSNLLGYVAEKCGIDTVLVPLKPALDAANATFKQNASGHWRFFFLDARGEVKDVATMRDLFYRCSGAVGSWTPDNRAYAKQWAACLANVWESTDACLAQQEFTKARLRSFVMANGKKILFDDPTPDAGWPGALRAAFVSFAANRPASAEAHVKIAADALASPKWSKEWCIGVIKELTFGPNIAIYPRRYNAIRPKLEELWGIELPKSNLELKAWSPGGTMTCGDKLIEILRHYVGCSLSARRDELGALVARGVDDPRQMVLVKTNCGTSALGVMCIAGVKDPLMTKRYVNGMAISWLRQIGLDRKALVKFDGKTKPKKGALLRYNTAGKNDDHVEWLLGDVADDWTAEHGGGGRADNAITVGTSDIRTNWFRPLVEWWDPDLLGIDPASAPVWPQVVVAPVPKPAPKPQPKPVVPPAPEEPGTGGSPTPQDAPVDPVPTPTMPDAQKSDPADPGAPSAPAVTLFEMVSSLVARLLGFLRLK